LAIFQKKIKENKLKESKNSSKFKKNQAKMPKTSKSGNSDLTFMGKKHFLSNFSLFYLRFTL